VPKPEFEVVAQGVITPEGPAEDARGNLYFVQRSLGKVSVVCGSAVHDVVDTGGKPQSVAVESSGSLLVPDAIRKALLRVTAGGGLQTLCDHCGDSPLRGPNDLVPLPGGGALVTDPGMDFALPGAVLWIDPTGDAYLLTNAMSFPNGIALHQDGRTLLVAESARDRIEEFQWRQATVSRRRTFAQLPEGSGPDGIALDSEGSLYVVCHFTGRVLMLDPAGRVVDVLWPGGSHPTNCTFGGPDFKSLYVTEDEAGHIVRFRRDVCGQVAYSRSQPRTLGKWSNSP